MSWSVESECWPSRMASRVPAVPRKRLGSAVQSRGAEQDLEGALAAVGVLGKAATVHQGDAGLMAMDANQLWITTLDPSHRRLRRMTLDDAEAAAAALDRWMGDNPAPRKDFIFAEGGLLDRSRPDV
ncbi:MAG: gyrase subunit [Frankiales bacterium]|nr:gyrase subunit [Frankiales bacterium]